MSNTQPIPRRPSHALPPGWTPEEGSTKPSTPPGSSASEGPTASHALGTPGGGAGPCRLADAPQAEGSDPLFYDASGGSDDEFFYGEEPKPPAIRSLVSRYEALCPEAAAGERTLLGSAVAHGVIDDCTGARGPSLHELRRSQRTTLAEGLGNLATSGAFEIGTGVTSEVAAGMLAAGFARRAIAGAALPLASFGMTVADMFDKWAEAGQEGQALSDAASRDSVHWSYVAAAAEALPQSYVASLRQRYSASLGAGEGAGVMTGRPSEVLTPLLANDASWEQLKSEVVSAVGEGRAMAQARGLDSRQALEQALSSDSELRERYREMGIRHGIDSYVFQRIHGYDD